MLFKVLRRLAEFDLWRSFRAERVTARAAPGVLFWKDSKG
jgi:hypothetical protein